MDEKRLASLRVSFAKKPTRELRDIVNAADSGDWAEEAIAVAREILATRPEEEISDEPAPSPPVPGRSFTPRPPLSTDQLAYYRDMLKFAGLIYMILGFVPLGIAFYLVNSHAVQKGFVSLFGLAASIGAILFFTGLAMRKPGPTGFYFALPAAGFTALFFPFGTLLGGFSIWALRKCKPIFFDPALELATRERPKQKRRTPAADK